MNVSEKTHREIVKGKRKRAKRQKQPRISADSRGSTLSATGRRRLLSYSPSRLGAVRFRRFTYCCFAILQFCPLPSSLCARRHLSFQQKLFLPVFAHPARPILCLNVVSYVVPFRHSFPAPAKAFRFWPELGFCSMLNLD